MVARIISHRAILAAAFSLALPLVSAEMNMWVDPAYVLQYGGSTLALESQNLIVALAPILAAQGPWAVTNQTVMPGSGNPRDYMSWAPYWWPNCNWCLNNATTTNSSSSTSASNTMTQSNSVTAAPASRRGQSDSESEVGEVVFDWLRGGRISRFFVARQTTKKTTTTTKKATTTTKKITTTTKKTTSTTTKKATSTTTKKSTTTTKKSTTTTTKKSTSTTQKPTTTTVRPTTTVKPTSTTPRSTSTTTHSTTISQATSSITTSRPTSSTTATTRSSTITASPTTAPFPAGCTPSPTTPLAPSVTWTACPYIRKDGQPNPDVRAAILDTVWITQLGESVLTSTLSAAFGRRPSGYAEAAQAIRVWFLDLETGVNPNLVYAQVIRGPGSDKKGGQYYGILDWRWMTKVVNTIFIMRAVRAPEWTSADDAAFVAWSRKYITWLTTSTLGKQLAASTNNHVTFFYNQLAAMHIMVGDRQAAINSLNTFFNGHFQNQIIASGEQPEESVRTLPGHYQAFNIEALIVNARLGDYLGQNYWTRTTSKGATIQTAVNYLMRFSVNPSSAVPAPNYNTNELAPHVALVAAAYGDPNGTYARWLDAVKFVNAKTVRDQAWYFFMQAEAIPRSPNGRGVVTSSRSYPAYTSTIPTTATVPTYATSTTTSTDATSTLSMSFDER